MTVINLLSIEIYSPWYFYAMRLVV